MKDKKTNEIVELNSGVTFGDLVQFGHYRQNVTLDKKRLRINKYTLEEDLIGEPEPITWIVLRQDKGHALLLSKYVLDCRRFNESLEKVSWEESTVRTWLNTVFYDKAFSEFEKGKIIENHTVNYDEAYMPNIYANVENGSLFNPAGDDTKDKVILLSYKQVMSSLKNKQAAPTKYAKYYGCYSYFTAKNEEREDTCIWYLRSPGKDEFKTACVLQCGIVETDGVYVDRTDIGLRPAIWVQV